MKLASDQWNAKEMGVLRCNVRSIAGPSRAGNKWTLGKFQQRQKSESLTPARNVETKKRSFSAYFPWK